MKNRSAFTFGDRKPFGLSEDVAHVTDEGLRRFARFKVDGVGDLFF